jgi:hypothetical protein
MIRLNLEPSVIKNLTFNKKDKSLEIEFKENIKTSKCINIPLSILKEYVDSLREKELFIGKKNYQSTLKIVHSNFKAC